METIDWWFRQELWRHDPDHATLTDQLCRGFNWIEAIAWIACAFLILRRHQRHHKSALEPVYALSFLLFAVTDLREAAVIHAWLIWVKAIILICILTLRQYMKQHHYPQLKAI